MRRVFLAAFLTLTCALVAGPALADEYPLTPDPATCDAEPIDIDALVERAATTYPAATPQAIPTATDAPQSLQDELMAVVVASVACTNANRPLEALASFTEDYLVMRISDEPVVTLGHLQAASTRRPDVAPPEDRVTIESVENASTWSGGAEVVLLWSNGGDPERVGLRFREVGGDWKIYEVMTEVAEP